MCIRDSLGLSLRRVDGEGEAAEAPAAPVAEVVAEATTEEEVGA